MTALRALDLDHAGLFVPDMDAAAAALRAMGFTLTPLTPQRTAAPRPGEPPAPAGTANRCIMLAGGYIEVLVAEPGADTPVARQLRAALARHTGLHLIAFGTADAEAEYRRLDEAGHAPLPLVPLERPVATAEGRGAALARSSVVRVPPGTMAEGRIQFVLQHTPDLVWQPRFLGHRNRVAALTLASGDLAVTRTVLATEGVTHRDASPGVVRVEPPPSLGATLLFAGLNAPSPWG